MSLFTTSTLLAAETPRATAPSATAPRPTAQRATPPSATAPQATPPQAGASRAGAARAGSHTDSPASFKAKLDAALEQYRLRRYAEARAAFAEALATAPASADGASLEFNIAACDYELGAYRDAEARFARLAAGDPARRGEALLHAAWSALGARDADAATRYLASMPEDDTALAPPRAALAQAIAKERRRADADQLESAVNLATLAYNAGDLAGAEARVREARRREREGTDRARAALDYLDGLIAQERGDATRARRLFERSLSRNPGDAAVHAALGELHRASGEGERSELHYRASLASGLSAADAQAVHQAIESLYPVPASGLSAWGALGTGYDSNATQSGSSDAVGFSGQGRAGSLYFAPAWGLEYRYDTGSHTRLAPYYLADWLMLASTPVRAASLQSHEAGLRFYAATRSSSLRLGLGAGITFSGLDPIEPFSLDAVLGGRATFSHGRHFRSTLLLEVRPALGLGDRDYLSGARSDALVAERYEHGPWAAVLQLGLRYNAIGIQSSPIDPAQFPRCTLGICIGSTYQIPLGYLGPIVGAELELNPTSSLGLGSYARYEYRAYTDESVIEGPALPELLSALSRKTRRDDRYLLGARARYRLDSEPELAFTLDYSMRISRSNIASQRGGLEHALDYDDRNFTQHSVELGVEIRR